MELHEKGILEKYGVEMIGAKPEAIDKGEDRQLFKEPCSRSASMWPLRTVKSMDEAARPRRRLAACR